jgi:hypothetical protein
MGFGLFPVKNQLAKFPKVFMGTLMGIILRLAIPECFLIELYPLRFDSSEYHGTQSPVAYRQGLIPVNSRLIVPESEFNMVFMFSTAT